MGWKIKLPADFSVWLSEIEKPTAQALIGAIKSIAANEVTPWEKELEGASVTKISNEDPELFKLVTKNMTCNIGVLYGVTANKLIIVGGYGIQSHLSLRVTIDNAQQVIAKMKGIHHD